MNTPRRRAAIDLEVVAVELRRAMVAQLKARGVLRTPGVIAAFSQVAREMFAPGSPLGEMYDRDYVVITERDADGVVTGSMTTPRVQALILEQSDIRPGMRVLQIGIDGYTAALLAEMVGPDGEVTTLDSDPVLTDRAVGCLLAAGYPQVRVLCRDPESGVPEHAPFDRVIVTAAAGDLPPAWGEQLVEGGVLVVPLRLRGLTRMIALVHQDGHLLGRDQVECGGLVPILGASPERLIPLHDQDVTLRLDEDQVAGLDVDVLRDALTSPQFARRAGVRVDGDESCADLDLYLTTKLDRFGLLEAGAGAIAAGLVNGGTRTGTTTAAVTATSFAYRTAQPTSRKRALFEFVVYGHGPDANTLVATYVALVREWDRTHRHGPGARIEVFPIGTPEAEITDQIGEGRLIDKKHTRLRISWPPRS